MCKVSNIIRDIKTWVNAGEERVVFVRKAFAVSLALLILYKFGYVIGTFLAQIGI